VVAAAASARWPRVVAVVRPSAVGTLVVEDLEPLPVAVVVVVVQVGPLSVPPPLPSVRPQAVASLEVPFPPCVVNPRYSRLF
jgi:hypothetical protein